MPEDSTQQRSGNPIHIRSVPDDRLHRPKHKPCAKPSEASPKLAPLPAFCRLSGGIQRLGGSAFSAFKPLLARTLRPQPPSIPQPIPQSSSFRHLGDSQSAPAHGALVACSLQSSERVDTSGESAASLQHATVSPTDSFQVSRRQAIHALCAEPLGLCVGGCSPPGHQFSKPSRDTSDARARWPSSFIGYSLRYNIASSVLTCIYSTCMSNPHLQIVCFKDTLHEAHRAF